MRTLATKQVHLLLFTIFLTVLSSEASVKKCPDLFFKPFAPNSSIVDDPRQFLEEVEGTAALNWVRAQNARTLKHFDQQRWFKAIKEKSLRLQNAKDRIPYSDFHRKVLYNFWKDETNVRGLLRRTTLSSFNQAQPVWETIIDIDELARTENENWVYSGYTSLHNSDRIILWLSRGGKDAVEGREFDLQSKNFVNNGFFLREAKSRVSWLDENHVIVGTDFGPDSLTQSGYPRMLKMWKRGTSLTEAPTIFRGDVTDVSVSSMVLKSKNPRVVVTKGITFFEHKSYLLIKNELVPLPLPLDSEITDQYQGNLLLKLKSDWAYQAATFTKGSLVYVDVNRLLKNQQSAVELLFEPDATMTIESVAASEQSIYIHFLKNVAGQIVEMSRQKNGSWKKTQLDLPPLGSVAITSLDEESDLLMVNYEDFLNPATLFSYSADVNKLEKTKALPNRFDPSRYEVNQFFATSKDGTRIPYFLVNDKDVVLDGQNPTLLYGYGGFEISETPYYSALTEYAWLRRKGVFVLANIRGGGEFGPAWHQAALKENRQRAFDDFYAIAEDLTKRGYTSPEHLGIMGGSNGGLLMGVAATQRPDLFNAVVCQVPLLDMLRYHKLLAGASWMAEYGNPEDPIMHDVLKAYSPYHNVRAHMRYPEIFFMTSTKDDRVHPAHARKMAKLMEELGHPFWYFENIEGGHGGAANMEQRALWHALTYSYLFEKLKRK